MKQGNGARGRWTEAGARYDGRRGRARRRRADVVVLAVPFFAVASALESAGAMTGKLL